MSVNPCHGCPDRKAGCHGDCHDYKSWRVKMDLRNGAIKKIKDVERSVIDIELARSDRIRRYSK